MTDNQQTLEQAMAAICAAHDFRNFSITHYPNMGGQGPRYMVQGQWRGYSQRGIQCADGCEKDIATALADCLANAKADRTPPEQEITELPAFEVQS